MALLYMMGVTVGEAQFYDPERDSCPRTLEAALGNCKSPNHDDLRASSFSWIEMKKSNNCLRDSNSACLSWQSVDWWIIFYYRLTFLILCDIRKYFSLPFVCFGFIILQHILYAALINISDFFDSDYFVLVTVPNKPRVSSLRLGETGAIYSWLRGKYICTLVITYQM